MKIGTQLNYFNYNHILLIMVLFAFFISDCKNTSKQRILIITGGHDFEHDAFFNIFNAFSRVLNQ